MHHSGDVLRPSSRGGQAWRGGFIRSAMVSMSARGLFKAETAVEVGADAHVPGVARRVGGCDRYDRSRVRASRHVLRSVLPRIQPGTIIQASSARAENRPARDQFLDLVIAELAAVGDKGAAVPMARPDGAVVEVEGLPEAIVAKVRGVEDDVQPGASPPAVRDRPGSGRRWHGVPWA